MTPTDDWDTLDDELDEEESIETRPVPAPDPDKSAPEAAPPSAGTAEVPRIADDDATYTVQDLLTDVNGKEFQRGEVIKVRCDRCAMWNKPIGFYDDAPLCAPGKLVDVEVEGQFHSWPMSADQYSCRKYFVPREEDLSKIPQMLGQKFGTLLGMKWAIPAAKTAIRLQDRLDAHFQRHLPDEDIAEAISNALLFATCFYSAEQLAYVKPLIEKVFTEARARKKAPRQGPRKPKPRIKNGSVYNWFHNTKPVSGWVHHVSPKKKRVTLMVGMEYAKIVNPGAPDAPCLVTYTFQQWREAAPQLVSEAVEFEAHDA